MLRCFVASVLALSTVPAVAAPQAELSAEDLRFALEPGKGARLTVRGVPVVLESHLYIVKPGWSGVLLNVDTMTPSLSVGASSATATYENANARARFEYGLEPDNVFRVEVTYGLKTAQPAEVEYAAAYLNGNLLSGRPFQAETVEGARVGTVPAKALWPDQDRSMLTPRVKRLEVDTAIGPMELTVEGSDDLHSALTLFDARAGLQRWAREQPLFWLGIGVPARPLTPGEHTVTTTYRFRPKPAPGVAEHNVTTGSVEDEPRAYDPSTVRLPLIPKPKEATFTNTPMRLDASTRIVLGLSPSEEEKTAARELQVELRDRWGVRLSIVRKPAGAAAPGEIRLGAKKAGGMALVSKPEGYSLAVSKGSAVVQGADGRGVYHGVQTLKQMLRRDAKGVVLDGASIRDWPGLAFRGIHWFGGPKALPFHHRMLARILAPLKMNAMVYEAEYTQWESMPGVWDAQRSTPIADVRRTVEIARGHLVEPIPMITTLGHTEWMFRNGQNLEITANRAKPSNYDPTNPKTYDVLFPVFEEVIDLFRPTWFHIGHDEVHTYGTFPESIDGKDVNQLFVEDTNRLHAWLKERGLRTVMWSDMMLHSSEAANSAANAPTVATAKRVRNGIPKEAIIADWHYASASYDYPSLDVWQGEGFEVIGCPWYQQRNIEDFAAALARRNALGFLQTTWAGYAMSLDLVTGPEFYQFAAYVIAAEAAWNGGANSVEDWPVGPDVVFRSLWNGQDAGPALAGFTVPLPSGHGDPAILAPAGRRRLGGTVFDVRPVVLAGALDSGPARPASVTLSLEDRNASELHFLWTATHRVPTDTQIGVVTVAYADGTAATAPIRYGRQVFASDDERLSNECDTPWVYGPKANRQRARRWAWKNLSPEKPMRTVTLESRLTEAAPVLLGLTGLATQ